ncbi:MAG: AraC family transcriptional regulator, partial [Chitinophagaceae bacterium]
MDDQLDYQRIAAAIEYISDNHLLQPSLEEVAKQVGISPFHFHKIFARWAGISPKKFLQYTTLS